ncbi:MAG TPA: PqqD family protein [Bryobacteraceae bacterium]|nr:PqqD family protein [Bryobacteraceae bacterium]
MSHISYYQPSENILCQKVGDEAVLLDMQSSKYFGLSSVATRIWELLEDGQSVDSAAETVAAQYHQPAGQVLKDTLAFIETAASRGLLRQRA